MKKPAKNNQTETAFAEIVNLIQSARQQAFQAVNTTLIERLAPISAARSKALNGVTGWWSSLLPILPVLSLVCGDLPGQTCFVCGNFM
jgi:hypothetical protein